MADQRFTIIVVPHDRPGVRKLQITGKLVLCALIALAIVSIAAIGTTVHYVKLYQEARNLEDLQKENSDLKDSLEKSQYLTQKLNKRISMLTDLSNKLKTMAGLPENPPGRKRGQQLPRPGVGGVSMSPTSLGAPDPQKLFSLEKRTRYLEQTFALLNDYFHGKNEKFSNTPSVLPTQGFLSSFFGSRRNPFTNAPDFHEGIDITNEIGTPVVAPASGVIVYTGLKGLYGKVVEIQHDDEIITLFGHLSTIQVKVGQKVSRWDVIGRIGISGRSTGPHLHYEVHVNDQPVNPLPYILDLDSLG